MKKEELKTGNIMLYKTNDGGTEIDVKFENDTVWLNQKQLAVLFDKWRTTVAEHIQNIFKEGELDEKSVCREFRQTADDGKKYSVKYYNLDVIISVGYRVKSLRGTQFRIWATQRLKDYLVKGFALNQKRLEETKLHELEQVVALIKKNVDHKWLSHKETAWLLNVITHYTYSWVLLQKYDAGELKLPKLNHTLKAELSYKEAKNAVQEMKKNFLPQKQVSELFGIERNDEFKGILQSIYQSFGGHELYPTVEEKATHLLYFVVKNHPFADGNKKIWAFLFLRFLAKNGCLYNHDGSKKIDDATVVAITLLVATCDKNQKDLVVRLILNFLAKKE